MILTLSSDLAAPSRVKKRHALHAARRLTRCSSAQRLESIGSDARSVAAARPSFSAYVPSLESDAD
jgi:hypothetical protein